MKTKKISTMMIVDGFNQEKGGWLISNKLYKDLKKTRYLDKYYRLSVDNGSWKVIKILDYRKSIETELPVMETIQYINALDKYNKALVRLRYLEIELIRKGEIDIEYKDNNHQRTISVYITE